MRYFIHSSRGVLPFGFCLFSCALSARAEINDTLSTVVVTAESLSVEQTDPYYAPGQVTVLQRSDFRADQFTLADVLEATPSVQVQSAGELGSYQSVSVRGAPGRQMLVYLDGILMTSAGGEAIDLGQLPLSQVESIEIYRSVAPPQFAQDAMGGVVNIITRRGGKTPHNQLSITAGSFGLWESQASHHQVGDRGSLTIQASALHIDNDFSYLYHNGTPAVSSDDEEVRRNNADYQRYHGAIDVQTPLKNQQWSAGLAWRYSRKSLPRWDNSDQVDTYYREREWRTHLGWSTGNDTQRPLAGALRLLVQSSEGHLFDPTAAVGLSANDSYDRDDSLQLNQLVVLRGDQHWLTLSGQSSWSQFALADTPNDVDYRYERWSQALSLTDEISIFQDQGMMVLSIRTLAATDEEMLWGGHLSAEWWLTNRLSWEILAKQSFRMPSLFERHGDQGYFRGNDDLQSEKNFLLESSLSRDGEDLDWSLTTFYRIAENNIAPVYDSQGVGHYLNIGEVYTQGFEWEAHWQVEHLRLFHQGSVQPSRLYSDTLAYNNNQAPGYYPLAFNSGFDVLINPWAFGFKWSYQEGLYYDRANSTQAPTRSEIDLSARRTWTFGSHHHQIEMVVANLLDNPSQDMTNKPLPGRRFNVGYSLSF